MDLATTLLTIILSLIALIAAILKGVQMVMRNMLITEGLIRPQRRGETPADHWPNGWHNLPDTLRGIYELVVKDK